jgi:hypothetical protein
VHLVGFYYKNVSRCTVLWMSNSKLFLTVKFIVIYYAVYYVGRSHPEAVGRTLNTLLLYLLWPQTGSRI